MLGNRCVNVQNIAPHYDRVKDDARYQTFVALIADEVVGFISSVQSFAVGFEGGFMHIAGLAVREDRQHQGIAKQLLRRMEEHAKAKGVHSILLNSGVKRTDAHAFYQHNGYDKDSWCFDKVL